MIQPRRFLPSLRLLALALALLLLPAATVRAQQCPLRRPAPLVFWAWVLKVHNGQEVTVGRLGAGPNGQTATALVRLQGLAGPTPARARQARQARQALAALVQSHHVLVVPIGFDAQGRLVARLFWQGADVSQTLAGRGGPRVARR